LQTEILVQKRNPEGEKVCMGLVWKEEPIKKRSKLRLGGLAVPGRLVVKGKAYNLCQSPKKMKGGRDSLNDDRFNWGRF